MGGPARVLGHSLLFLPLCGLGQCTVSSLHFTEKGLETSSLKAMGSLPKTPNLQAKSLLASQGIHCRHPEATEGVSHSECFSKRRPAAIKNLPFGWVLSSSQALLLQSL